MTFGSLTGSTFLPEELPKLITNKEIWQRIVGLGEGCREIKIYTHYLSGGLNKHEAYRLNQTKIWATWYMVDTDLVLLQILEFLRLRLKIKPGLLGAIFRRLWDSETSSFLSMPWVDLVPFGAFFLETYVFLMESMIERSVITTGLIFFAQTILK